MEINPHVYLYYVLIGRLWATRLSKPDCKIYDGTSGYFNLMTPSTYARLINSSCFTFEYKYVFFLRFSFNRKPIESRRVQQRF